MVTFEASSLRELYDLFASVKSFSIRVLEAMYEGEIYETPKPFLRSSIDAY